MDRRTFLATASASIIALKTKGYVEIKSSMDDVLDRSAKSIAKLIRTKQVSSLEVVKAHLERIALVNRKINAVCTLAAERALDEARQADKLLVKGVIKGPFHGVPMTIKDSIDTAGVITTAGTTGRKSFIPKKDATIVQRLRDNGAILLGKTNTPELTMDFDTHNRLFGITRNPYNLEKSPGGSSGGEAAIIASGGSPFGFGSDTGGSIRIPSCFCGLAGIRTSRGLLPLTGHIINSEQGMIAEETRLGPISRQVDDLYPLLKVTCGPDGIDKLSQSILLKDPEQIKIENLRIVYFTNNGIKAASADVVNTVNTAVSAIANVGGKTYESCPEMIAQGQKLHDFASSIDGGQWALNLVERFNTPPSERNIGWVWQKDPLSQEEKENGIKLRNQYRYRMNVWMNDYDALICPVTAEIGFPTKFSGSKYFDINDFTYTMAFSLTDWPVAVVRCGTSVEGLPIGVQVIAKHGREDICLAVAKYLETSLGGWQKPTAVFSS